VKHCVCVARRGKAVGLDESTSLNSDELSPSPIATPMDTPPTFMDTPPTSLLFREHTVQELLVMLGTEETAVAGDIWENFLMKSLQ